MMSGHGDPSNAETSNESKDIQSVGGSIPTPENSMSKDKSFNDIGALEAQVQLPQRAGDETHSPAPVQVPRSRRRGLLGRCTILAEVGEPKDYLPRTKWFITFVVAMAGIAAPMGSTIFFRKPS